MGHSLPLLHPGTHPEPSCIYLPLYIHFSSLAAQPIWYLIGKYFILMIWQTDFGVTCSATLWNVFLPLYPRHTAAVYLQTGCLEIKLRPRLKQVNQFWAHAGGQTIDLTWIHYVQQGSPTRSGLTLHHNDCGASIWWVSESVNSSDGLHVTRIHWLKDKVITVHHYYALHRLHICKSLRTFIYSQLDLHFLNYLPHLC